MMDGGTNNEPAQLSEGDVLDAGLETHAIVREEAAVPSSVPSRRLDFLRGAAALYVVIGHARGHLFAGGAVLTEQGALQWHDYVMLALLQLTSMGTEAVILFFVLSGFAMAHSLPRSGSTLGFYKKRLIRIWPPYLAAVACAFVIAGVILMSPVPNAVTAAVNETVWDWRTAVAMAFYAKVGTILTGQFWSLPQEVLFYALCPLLLATRKRIAAFCMLAAVLTAVGIPLFGVQYDLTGGVPFRHFLFSLLFFFMTGAVVYHHQHRIPRLSGRVLLVTFLVSFVVIWFVKYRVFGGWNLVTNVMVAPIAVLLIGNVPASLYGRNWLNWGHFSYSLYVFHMQILVFISYVLARFWGLEQPAMTSYWMWMLAVPPVVGICWLLYLGIEKRCDAVLARVRERERASPGGAADLAGRPQV